MGGAHPGAGEERYRFPLHTPEIGPQTRAPITLLKLIPKTIKGVSVSVIKTEINSERI